MTNYSDKDNSVRVDFFKESGKWYTTEAVEWTGSWDGNLHEDFAKSLRDHLGDRLKELDAVCLKPYNKNAHPIQLKNGKWWR